MSTFNLQHCFEVVKAITTLLSFSSKNLMFLKQTMTNNSVKELSVRNGMPMIIVISSRMVFRKLLCHSFHDVVCCMSMYYVVALELTQAKFYSFIWFELMISSERLYSKRVGIRLTNCFKTSTYTLVQRIFRVN